MSERAVSAASRWSIVWGVLLFILSDEPALRSSFIP